MRCSNDTMVDSMETGSLFGFTADDANCTMTGLQGGEPNRKLVLVNEGAGTLTILSREQCDHAQGRL
jgi:hypothetical protein